MIRSKPEALRRAALAALGLLLAIAPAVARADNSPAVEKLIQMNKKALEDYDQLEWETAKRTLLQALVFAKKSSLETHPMMARTYVHLGAVYIVGFKDRAKGMQSFQRALEIDPGIHITKSMSTPELEDAFAEAARGPRAASGGSGGGDESAAPAPPRKRRGPIMESADAPAAPPPRAPKRPKDDDSVEPDLPARINVLECRNKDETPPDKPVIVRCAVAPNLPITQLFLLYLEPGNKEFTSAEMEKSPKGWFTAKIPKDAVNGTSLRFYVEGRNSGGKKLVENGRADSPNVILIREAGADEAEKEAGMSARRRPEDEDENPLAEPDPTRAHSLLGKIDRSKLGVDTRYGNRKWWIGLGIGTGGGFAKGNGFEALSAYNQYFRAGFGWAGFFHLVPELGYQLSPDWALSLEGRNQYIYQNAHFAPYTASGANSVLLRVIRYSKQQRLRFFGSAAVGGGEGFRLIVFTGSQVAQVDPKAGQGDSQLGSIRDTVLGGPALVGAGGGIIYEMSKGVSYVMEMNVLAGLPTFSAVADVNFGFQINFERAAAKPAETKMPALRSTRKPGAQEEDDE
jgi:hypothetical protein